MRIKLDKEKNIKTSKEVIDNYEKYSRKIDAIYNNDFQKAIKPLISPAVTLEKEKDRLRRLIKLLEDRLDKRIELEDKYYKTTGRYISGLQLIVSEGELQEKKERLSVINRYLDTKEEIENVTESISKIKISLLEEENRKIEYENKNKLMEDELYSSFMTVINKDEYYKSINVEDITSELDKIRGSISETKETLDITRDSIGSLINTGMDDDYTSYIEEAEKSYYNFKNKEIILKLYKLVIDFEDDFKLICSKREKISDLLLEKKELINNLIINVDNELESFEKTVLLQNNVLDVEREIIENIANYTSRISFKEERLEELNEVNNSIEILTILREYGLIDTYDSDKINIEDISLLDTSNDELKNQIIDDNKVLDTIEIPSISEDIISKFELPSLELPSVESVKQDSESVIEEVYDPYRIVEIIDYPKTLNVGLAKLKGESVREKVNKKLNPVIDNIKDNVSVENNNIEEKSSNLTQNGFDFSTNNELNLDFSVSEDKVENNLIVEEKTNNTPVWELPMEMDVKLINFDNEVSSLPIWESVNPSFDLPKSEESVSEIDNINIVSAPKEASDNMFWVPVSESKIDNNSFPSLKLPNSNINKNNEFVFPNIDN